jgi:hypothetical protein
VEEQARSQTYGVVTGSGTDIGLARSERVVVVHVDAGHDESTTHDVELVLAHDRSRNSSDLGRTDPHTELVERDERHPLFVEHVLSRDVRGDVPADRVSDVFGTVRVKLTTGVAVRDVDPGSVPETVDLDVSVGLDEVSRVDGSIRNQPGSVPRLGAVGDDDGLDVPDDRIWAGLGGSEDAKVVDAVQGQKTGVRGLVDLGAGFGDLGPVRVGRSVGEGGGDLSPGKGEGQQRGDGRETLESSGNHLYSSAM